MPGTPPKKEKKDEKKTIFYQLIMSVFFLKICYAAFSKKLLRYKIFQNFAPGHSVLMKW